MIRNAMERWNNGINDFANNTGVTTPADYQTDLFVEQLIEMTQFLKLISLEMRFHLTIGTIDLSSATRTIRNI